MTTEIHSIADVAEMTGLTKDTLRWYEREGLLPRVDRDTSGHRRYDERLVRTLHLLVRLRRTGMPVADVKRFVEMLDQGAVTHGRRAALLRDHRQRIIEQIADLHADLAAVDDKIEHYERLIAAGWDCNETPISDLNILNEQGRSE